MSKENKRYNPFKSAGKATVIGLAKHKTEIDLKNKEIQMLKDQVESSFNEFQKLLVESNAAKEYIKCLLNK